jgi:hypothetical protein
MKMMNDQARSDMMKSIMVSDDDTDTE